MKSSSKRERQKSSSCGSARTGSTRPDSGLITYTCEGHTYTVPRRCRRYTMNGSIRNVWIAPSIPNPSSINQYPSVWSGKQTDNESDTAISSGSHNDEENESFSDDKMRDNELTASDARQRSDTMDDQSTSSKSSSLKIPPHVLKHRRSQTSHDSRPVDPPGKVRRPATVHQGATNNSANRTDQAKGVVLQTPAERQSTAQPIGVMLQTPTAERQSTAQPIGVMIQTPTAERQSSAAQSHSPLKRNSQRPSSLRSAQSDTQRERYRTYIESAKSNTSTIDHFLYHEANNTPTSLRFRKQTPFITEKGSVRRQPLARQRSLVQVRRGDDDPYKDVFSVVKDLAEDDEMSDRSLSVQSAGFSNSAVERAFDKLMQPISIQPGGKVRLGLITNDITPRVYLQPSEGSRTFRRRNCRLRERLVDVYHYRDFDEEYPDEIGAANSSLSDRLSEESLLLRTPMDYNYNAT